VSGIGCTQRALTDEKAALAHRMHDSGPPRLC